jgi:5'-methylthioadenosine phosphorylase
MSKIGIITGSGIDELLFVKDFKAATVKTNYGLVPVREGVVAGREIVFLNRHGKNYSPPQKINFRGNIEALKKRGVERIIATAAVGSLFPRLKPGDFVLLSDFIDFTRSRAEYFNPSSFTDVSFPYDALLRKRIRSVSAKLKIKMHPCAVYVCSEGPRFESQAEIKMYRKLGAGVVGMTNVPEVILAAERGIAYAAIAVVTNYAAGVSPKKISSQEVIAMMREKLELLSRLIYHVISSFSSSRRG